MSATTVTDFDEDICIVEIPVPSDPFLPASSTNDTEDTLDKPSVKKVRFQPEDNPCKRKTRTRVNIINTKRQRDSRRQTNSPTLDKGNDKPEDTKDSRDAISTSLVIGDTVIPPVHQDKPSIDNDVCYEVEAILGHRIRLDSGKPEFLLKWKGYSNSENSWEPPVNLAGCTEMLHLYITEKVLPLNKEPLIQRVFLKLLPAELRKNGFVRKSKQGTDCASQKESKKNGMKVVAKPKTHAKVSSKVDIKHTRTDNSNHVTKHGQKRPHSASKPAKEPAAVKTSKQSSKQSSHTIFVSTKKSKTTHHSGQGKVTKSRDITGRTTNSSRQDRKHGSPSKKCNKATKMTQLKPSGVSDQVQPLQCSEKDDKGQENVVENGMQASRRSHSVESLKECSLHCNGVLQSNTEPDISTKYMPPHSPDLCFSPECHDKSVKTSRLSNGSVASSINDSLHFDLHLSPSPTSIASDTNSFSFESDFEDSNYHVDGTPHTHLSSVPVNGSPLTEEHSSYTGHLPQSSVTESMDYAGSHIPMFLLHKQKLFSTPMPLPRSKPKRCWSQVPTKAAKRASPLRQSLPLLQDSKRPRRHTVETSEVSVISKVLRSNGVHQGLRTNGLSQGSRTNGLVHKDYISRTDTDSTVSKPGLSNLCKSESQPLVNGVKTVSQTPNGHPPTQLNCVESSTGRPLMPLRIGRATESAAILLYKELLLEWQHQLNRQRDGTDEFILVENDIDRVPPPFFFKYISSNHYALGVPKPTDPEVSSSLCGCECYVLGKKCGTKSSICCPKMANAEFAYSRAGKVQVEPGTPIYECNSKCSCPADCLNKVVQHGRKIPLCVFRTRDGRGWGVKTIQPIKAHTFITEYVGEVITSEEAERRGHYYDQVGATYLFDLDFDDDNSDFTIDAAKEGNISHFFNHSCQPNLVVYSVWIESLDKRLPRIAFFTTRNVSAGEELTFDYQMNHDQSLSTPGSSRQKKLGMRCLCGTDKCLGYYW